MTTDQQTLASLQEDLKAALGTPAEWEILFDASDQPVNGSAERAATKFQIENPFFEVDDPSGKPNSAYVDPDAWPRVFISNNCTVHELFQKHQVAVPSFLVAGEPRRFARDVTKMRFGILVAGGSAAGLNVNVDSIVKRLTAVGSKHQQNPQFEPGIYGYIGGYKGLIEGHKRDLTRKDTDRHAGEPCIFLKTLRGPKDPGLMADGIMRDNLDVLFVVGGNGTYAAGKALHEELQQRGKHDVQIIAGPKTMDMDLFFADATFGFQSAVENALQFVRTMHWEAQTLDRVVVVELFGAASGFVALHAGFVSGEADVIVVPEFNHDLGSIAKRVAERVRKNGHALVVAAEGAIKRFAHGSAAAKKQAFDAFCSNLEDQVNAGLRTTNGPPTSVTGIQPKHLIRGTAPNAFDLDLAKYSGYLMADAALAGFTNCAVHMWHGQPVLVPIQLALGTRRVPPWSNYYWYMASKYSLPLQ